MDDDPCITCTHLDDVQLPTSSVRILSHRAFHEQDGAVKWSAYRKRTEKTCRIQRTPSWLENLSRSTNKARYEVYMDLDSAFAKGDHRLLSTQHWQCGEAAPQREQTKMQTSWTLHKARIFGHSDELLWKRGAEMFLNATTLPA